MEKPESIELFLQQEIEGCFESYRSAYTVLFESGLMYEPLDNVLMRSVENKLKKVKKNALQYWGSIEVDVVFTETRKKFKFSDYQKNQ